MARCERCGKKITKDKNQFNFEITQFEVKEASLLGFAMKPTGPPLKLNLCISCFEEFREWLEDKTETKK